MVSTSHTHSRDTSTTLEEGKDGADLAGFAQHNHEEKAF